MKVHVSTGNCTIEVTGNVFPGRNRIDRAGTIQDVKEEPRIFENVKEKSSNTSGPSNFVHGTEKGEQAVIPNVP